MEKLKPQLKIADKFLDVKSDVVLGHLDELIKLREMPVDKRLKLLK